ncbi:MAG TPA: hypothetical protein VGM56_02285 [Byssovorax sp.]|jgi:hypothetical protein
MTDDTLKNVLELVRATADKDGWSNLPDGKLMTLYAGHDGVPLTIQKIESLRVAQGIVRAKTAKGEEFMLAVADLFATALDAGTAAATARKAGFLG